MKLLYIAILAASLNLQASEVQKVEIGQVWEWCSSDPFDPDPCYKSEILEMKGDYVRYKKLKSGSVESVRKGLYLSGSKLIKPASKQKAEIE